MRPDRKLAILCAAAIGALAASASPAAADPVEFAPFADCPMTTTGVEACVFAESESGEIQLSKRTIPLVNPVTLQGGYESTPQFFGAQDGETLSKTPEPVPGGLLGITAPTSWPAGVQTWFNNTVELGYTGVTATMELAEPDSSIGLDLTNLLYQSGTALGLPVKFKLSNPILGSSCHVGSNASPIHVELTTGTDWPYTGSPGSLTFNDDFTILTFSEVKLVSANFAAPAAEECGGPYSSYVDPLVNSIFGLPASSGKNAAVLEGTIEVAEDAAVVAALM